LEAGVFGNAGEGEVAGEDFFDGALSALGVGEGAFGEELADEAFSDEAAGSGDGDLHNWLARILY